MPANVITRPTHKHLPEVMVPPRSRREPPKEITVSHVEGFLNHRDKNRKTLIARLTNLALIPCLGTPDVSLSKKGDGTKGKGSAKEPSNRENLEGPSTLEFTDHESERLQYLEAELAKAKALHKDLYYETHIGLNDREVTKKCREIRKRREQLDNEISEMYRNRNVRRNFRWGANHPEGVTN
ncbi:uncharacterized protein F4812DRAFT_458652 [Daldinia caldariorum]|uniref:uncharacterized protein n=1 Tax=Daldinia caldariorum TaxID=326644 RepID=UPI002008C7F5|nr:uncharacterized protein F4812DRAFT_458652 [Daldinia caldariorum]KAI1468220.1 hypothetical protein F4812DRAFT_458652 [Daldinia caldariorum]